jgi:serine/threonine protein kinase
MNNPPPPPQASQPRLQPNDVVENPNGDVPDVYRVVRLVGVGGMGAVYEAIRKSTQTRVALKEILFNPDELEASYFQKLQSAFLKEARILITLDRESFPPDGAAVPQAYDIFRANGIWYLVMEYMEGKTLSELIGIGEHIQALPAEDVIKWGIQLSFTLEHLHQQTPPLIHADIKPSNIKINSKGNAALLDFGIAKGGYGYPSVPFTRGTIRFATPYYAAPEQYRAQALSPATDVFALAATLYHAATGERPPRVDERLYAMALDQRGDPLRPAHEVNPLVPRYLSQILALGMSLEVLQRPTNAAQFRTMLEQRRADVVINMSDVGDMWGKPRGRYDAAGGVAAPKPTPKIPSDRVPSDRVREPRIPSDRVPSDRVREPRPPAERVPSDRVRSDPVRDPVPSPLIPPGWSENPRPSPNPSPPPSRTASSGSRSKAGRLNPMMLTAIALAGVAVLMLALIFVLPSEEVPATGDDGAVGNSSTPTVPNTEPTEASVSPTEEVVVISLDDPTPTGEVFTDTTPLEEPTDTNPTPGAAATSTRIQLGDVPTAAPDANPTAAPTQAGGSTPRPVRSPTAAAPTPVPVVRLLSPAADSRFGVDSIVGFAWQWDGQLQGSQYFDLRIWRDGEPHRGVAAFTGTSGEYRASALGPGTYFWSVAVVDNGGATLIAGEGFPPRRLIVE